MHKLLISILFVLLALEAFAPADRIQAGVSAPGPYDLIDAVNGYRAANGLYSLDPNSLVMAAAQAHADWIVETGNGGHIGAGGSDETIRVAWTGYGGGSQIHCDEGWAGGTNVEDVVYSSWADWVHQGVMLDYWGNGYTDVGAGVADQGNGRYVFVLDVCMISGKPSTKRPTAVNTPGLGDSNNGITDPTSDTSQLMFAVVKSTPEADGSVVHTVQYGQSLVQIALAYGTKVNEIRQLNNIAEDSTLIYPEQKLVIFKSSTGIISTAVGETTGTADSTISGVQTLDPTYTARPKVTPSILPQMLLPSPTPTPEAETSKGGTVQTAGLVLVVICGIGILVYMGFSLKK